VSLCDRVAVLFQVPPQHHSTFECSGSLLCSFSADSLSEFKLTASLLEQLPPCSDPRRAAGHCQLVGRKSSNSLGDPSNQRPR